MFHVEPSNWKYARPTYCLACGGLYDAEGFGDLPAPCPRRYLSPHDGVFRRLVEKMLVQMGASNTPSVEQHAAAISQALTQHETSVK